MNYIQYTQIRKQMNLKHFLWLKWYMTWLQFLLPKNIIRAYLLYYPTCVYVRICYMSSHSHHVSSSYISVLLFMWNKALLMFSFIYFRFVSFYFFIIIFFLFTTHGIKYCLCFVYTIHTHYATTHADIYK